MVSTSVLASVLGIVSGNILSSVLGNVLSSVSGNVSPNILEYEPEYKYFGTRIF